MVNIGYLKSSRKKMRRVAILLICANIIACFGISPILADSLTEQTFTYDANGNMVSGFGLTFTYNDANRLVKITNQSTGVEVAEYFYDDAGNRIRKLEGGVDTYYIGECYESRVNETSVENTSYYFANNERIARKDPDGSRYWYHGDHLGSTSIVTDASGNVVESVNYYPYGAIESRTGSGSTYLYTDQELDPESGLYYYGARYYSPEIMRFAKPDPVIQNVYNPQNLNRYSYVVNNPMKYVDPTGLYVKCEDVVFSIGKIYGTIYCEDYITHEWIIADILGAGSQFGFTTSDTYANKLPEDGCENYFGGDLDPIPVDMSIVNSGDKWGIEGSTGIPMVIDVDVKGDLSGDREASTGLGFSAFLGYKQICLKIKERGVYSQDVWKLLHKTSNPNPMGSNPSSYTWTDPNPQTGSIPSFPIDDKSTTSTETNTPTDSGQGICTAYPDWPGSSQKPQFIFGEGWT